MELVWTTLQLAIGAGLATTFDDNIYLTSFFGDINRNFQPRHVIMGELIGFTVLILISLLGYWIGLAIPRQTIGLLGLLPILIGIRYLIERWHGREESDRQPGDYGLSLRRGFIPSRRPWCGVLSDRQTYRVSLVTVSNGSNNLSIYIPLFASLSASQNLLIIAVLYSFIGLWLLLSFHLSRAPGIALLLNRYAPKFLPFILIWLGYRILSESGTLTILNQG